MKYRIIKDEFGYVVKWRGWLTLGLWETVSCAECVSGNLHTIYFTDVAEAEEYIRVQTKKNKNPRKEKIIKEIKA